MRKVVSVMQHGYLPWLGFFELLWKSDVFVIYDDVQYDKNGWRNRNRIKTRQGPVWLTVPVTLPNGLKTKINEVMICKRENWQKRHLMTIEQNYSAAPYFKEYFPSIKDIIMQEHELLVDLNSSLLFQICGFLGMKKEIVFSSSLGIKEDNKIRRLIQITKELGGNYFYEPSGGKRYIGDKEIEDFKNEGIAFEFQDYKHPVYKQLFGEFVPFMSVIDLLFNEGERSIDIILQGTDINAGRW